MTSRELILKLTELALELSGLEVEVYFRRFGGRFCTGELALSIFKLRLKLL